MKQTTEALLALQSEIQKATSNAAELGGQLKAVKKQMKEDWGCNTLEEAEEKLEEIYTNISTISKKIQKGLDKLQDEYNIQE